MIGRTQKTDFKGRPLIEIPENIPTIGYLEGNFGKEILQAYNKTVEEEFDNSGVLKVLHYKNEVVKGSNPFAACLTNRILEEKGLRIATQADLEKAINLGMDFRGQYEDTALVLRNTEESNKYLAENLYEQVKARQKIKYPVMINLTDLEAENDSKSPHGLSFKLRDDAKIIHASQLDNKNDYKRFSKTDENGLPIFDEKGNRTLYTRDSGLSGLCLYRDLGLGSGGGSLAGSGSDGRVVAVSEQNAQIEKYIDEIDKETAKKIEGIQRIRDEAILKIRKQ